MNHRVVVLGLFVLASVAAPLFAAEGLCVRENSFQTDCPVIRSERPFKLQAIIENDNSVACDYRIVVPDCCTVTGAKSVSSNKAATPSWDVVCHTVGQFEFSLELLANGSVIQKSTISQAVLPPHKIEKLDYIPEPKPAKTDLLVGAINCHAWERDRADLWNQIVKKHQERTPALGIYSQDNPEISDWDTKWALEHGVSFFIYCWYRTSQDGPVTTMFEQSVFDDALLASRCSKKSNMSFIERQNGTDRNRCR